MDWMDEEDQEILGIAAPREEDAGLFKRLRCIGMEWHNGHWSLKDDASWVSLVTCNE
jgi:hypothetical protein